MITVKLLFIFICTCVWACENQPWQRKLHQVIFLLIFSSECSTPFLYIAEESLFPSALVCFVGKNT